MIRARNHYYYPVAHQDYPGRERRAAAEASTTALTNEIAPKATEKATENAKKKTEDADIAIIKWWNKMTKKNEKKVEPKKTVERVATLSFYSRVVKWINDAISPNDTRAYNPNPLFSFACRYNLLDNEPEEIYRDFVAYQCIVYAEADERLSPESINETPFADLQVWYENLRDSADRDLAEAKDWTCF